jgi:hypothetical protein
MENKKNRKIGKAKTVLISQQSTDLVAISEIIAKASYKTGVPRIRFTGSVIFSDKTQKHIQNNILPLTDTIIQPLGLPEPCYEISAVNPDIASQLDTAVNVSGFSADLSVFMAMLSAALHIPVTANTLFTGHISSADGDIGPVASIEAKMSTAAEDNTISKFIYPQSNLIEQCFDRDTLCIIPVTTISELIEAVFEKEDVIISSLKNGFFLIDSNTEQLGDCIKSSSHYLTADNRNHFWRIIRRNLMTSKTSEAKEMLSCFAMFYIKQKCYPEYFGDKLFSIICGTPPAVRRQKEFFPLLDIGLCINLAGFAKKSDYDDVFKLFDAVKAKTHRDLISQDTSLQSSNNQSRQQSFNIFDKVIAEIDELAIAQNFGCKIDSARASFILDSVIVENHQEFLETITAFYIHLRCYQATDRIESIDQKQSQSQAIELAQNTFSNDGGIETALQRAKDGTAGGMRKIFDEMTDFYKQDRRRKYIIAVFRQSVDNLSWSEKVEFMRCAMERLANYLPLELKNEPAERFARDYEAIALGYVNSMEKFNQLIKRF